MRWPYTGGFGMQLGDARTYSYWDAGTGTVDFSEPHATVEMGHPPESTRYTWQSAPPPTARNSASPSASLPRPGPPALKAKTPTSTLQPLTPRSPLLLS